MIYTMTTRLPVPQGTTGSICIVSACGQGSGAWEFGARSSYYREGWYCWYYVVEMDEDESELRLVKAREIVSHPAAV